MNPVTGNRKYHSLPEIFKEEAEGTRRVTHRICAVKNDKGIKSGVVELDIRCNSYPI
jgi:hypothetical protein